MPSEKKEIVEITIRLQLEIDSPERASSCRAYLQERYINNLPVEEKEFLKYPPDFRLFVSGSPVSNSSVTNIHLSNSVPLPF